MEASSARTPKVVNGKVKVVMITGYVDSNQKLISGSNNVCILWSSKDKDYEYVTCNGGVKYNDPNAWSTKKDVKINTKWKQVEDVEFRYAYAGTVGRTRPDKVKVYIGEADPEEINNLLKQDEKTVTINAVYYFASESVRSVIKDWKNKGYL